jgi:CDP-glycerol glycerophosphotransferase
VDVSQYPAINDLMLAADILVSDYSSIFFDFSILAKPMICFTYDYDKYAELRGLYFDIREELPGGSISQSELLDLIKNLDYQDAKQRAIGYRDKFLTAYGTATERCLDAILENIS